MRDQRVRKTVPEEMTAVLDDDGHFVVPSFINATIYRGNQECWVIDQVPAAGTVVTCEQSLTMELLYTCGSGEQRWARLPITLVDVSPPEIDIVIDSSGEPHLSFGGVARYISPVVVLPLLTASDSCAGASFTEITLNGAAYQIGVPIVSSGVQILRATAIDASGNLARLEHVFEIRPRPSHTAAAVVRAIECEVAGDGTTTVNASLLISSPTFDHRQILFSSVGVLLRLEDDT